MPKVHNWEDWDEVEEDIQKDQNRPATSFVEMLKETRVLNSYQRIVSCETHFTCK